MFYACSPCELLRYPPIIITENGNGEIVRRKKCCEKNPRDFRVVRTDSVMQSLRSVSIKYQEA